MNIDDDRFSRLVAHWQRAAIEPSHWREAIAEVARNLNATGCAMFTPVIDTTNRFLAAHWGTGESSLPQYLAHWVTEDPWIEAVQRSGTFEHAGAVNLSRVVLPASELRKTGFYNDFTRPHDIEELVSLKLCDATDRSAPVTHLSFFRQPGSLEFGDAEREVLTALWPHLQRAIHSYWLLRKARDHDRIAEQTLDALPHPAWVLHADATIAFANAAARALMQEAVWVGTLHGRLVRVGQLDSAAFAPAFAARGASVPPLLVASCVVAGRLRRATVHISPIREQPAYGTAWPQASALLMLDLPSPEQLAQSWLLAFARQHRLTPAETQLLKLLARGQDLPAIAEGLNVAYSTVRSHMGTLLAKTGCARQADLMRRLFEA
jgi:DNA-binding CsgD family transcriptional regulator